MYTPGNTAHLHRSQEKVLSACVSVIFRHAKEFGGVFLFTVSVVSDLIDKDLNPSLLLMQWVFLVPF
jgi:hypothetical protein